MTTRPAVDLSILAMLTFRRYVPHLVVVERSTTEFTDWALLYPQRGETFLIEYVDRIGLHEFVVTDLGTAAAAMIEWTGSNTAEGQSILDISLTREQVEARPEELQPLSECLFSTIITRFDPEAPDTDDWYGVHAGPVGSFVCAPESPADGVGGDLVRYRSLDIDQLALWWEQVLR